MAMKRECFCFNFWFDHIHLSNIDCLTAPTACLVCFISTGCSQKRKKRSLIRPALVASTQQTLSNLFWRLLISMALIKHVAPLFWSGHWHNYFLQLGQAVWASVQSIFPRCLWFKSCPHCQRENKCAFEKVYQSMYYSQIWFLCHFYFVQIWLNRWVRLGCKATCVLFLFNPEFFR
jgi:hypothetical protein